MLTHQYSIIHLELPFPKKTKLHFIPYLQTFSALQLASQDKTREAMKLYDNHYCCFTLSAKPSTFKNISLNLRYPLLLSTCPWLSNKVKWLDNNQSSFLGNTSGNYLSQSSEIRNLLILDHVRGSVIGPRAILANQRNFHKVLFEIEVQELYTLDLSRWDFTSLRQANTHPTKYLDVNFAQWLETSNFCCQTQW